MRSITVLCLGWGTAVAAMGCGGTEASSGAVPDEYKKLCTESVPCSSGSEPPALSTHYSGEGTTQRTSNELWAVGQTDPFVTILDTSVDGQISGSFDMGWFEIEVSGAEFKGKGDSFTIYGMDVFEDDECEMEARVVITGTQDAATGDLAGVLSLEFTRVTGPSCSAEELAYPGTGAEFSYRASVLDCDAQLAAARAFVLSEPNRACSTDVECIAEGVGCAQLEGAYCGQIALNLQTVASEEWSTVKDNLRACSPPSCSVCAAQLIPRCVNNVCQ